jgi:fatty-acyl-CoA synthase
LPKGVVWRHGPLFRALGSGGISVVDLPPVGSVEELTTRIASGGPSVTTVVGSPLMHGTGQLRGLMGLVTGGAIVTVRSHRLDVGELLGAVEADRAEALIVVGQAFGRPLVAHLDAHPHRYDLSCLRMVISSGAMWSAAGKAALLAHVPSAAILDSLGASEAVGMAIQVTRAGDVGGERVGTGRFVLGPHSAVFTEDGRRVAPGDPDPGLIAIGGAIPDGYRGDPARTARTFRMFEGRRWAVPGDWCRLLADGTVELLGRGSSCINTGGEKVWPEEVEEALKSRADVADAIVVGVPDERFGEAVGALVELVPGAAPPTPDELAATVRAHLAHYKAPRHVVLVDSIGRGPNGKADLPRLRALALAALGRDEPRQEPPGHR